MALTNGAIEGLARSDLALRDWKGLLADRATGRIADLLPGPAPK